MQFFAHFLPTSPIAADWARHDRLSGKFLGVTFNRRLRPPPARYESGPLTTDQVAELRQHPDDVVLEALTNTRLPAEDAP